MAKEKTDLPSKQFELHCAEVHEKLNRSIEGISDSLQMTREEYGQSVAAIETTIKHELGNGIHKRLDDLSAEVKTWSGRMWALVVSAMFAALSGTSSLIVLLIHLSNAP